MERYLRQKLPNGRFEDVEEARSRNMRSIKGKGNKSTEARLRAALVQAGVSGWKVNASSLLGKPDIFFPEHRLVIFVDGCFWHGCSVCGRVPKRNREFWTAKIARNIERDSQTAKELKAQGYRVLRLWEHDLRNSLGKCLKKIKKMSNQD